MTKPQQIPLPFSFRPSLDRMDFVVTETNETAMTWIDEWPHWPGSFLALHGPSGSGKSHLAHIWAEKSQAVEINQAYLDQGTKDLELTSQAFVLDHIDPLALSIPAQESLLHLFNHIKENSGFLLIANQSPPANWHSNIRDLQSRLTTIPAIKLDLPSDDLFLAVAMKLAADRRLTIKPNVMMFAIRRLERRFDTLQQFIHILDETAMVEKKAITIPMTRQVLDKIVSAEADI